MSWAKPCQDCGHNKTLHKWDRRPGVRFCTAKDCACKNYRSDQ